MPDFQQILEIVESMTPQDQEALIEVVRHRLVEMRRDEIAQNALETLQAVREGRASYGSARDLENTLGSEE
jgi:hypothetical protein